jgi:molecular chaperone DnaJ
MASVPDLYAVLGVAREATNDDIRRAYRRLARELHPDINADPEAERRFKEITAAYETLSDPGRRRQYDTWGQRGAPPDLFPFGDFGDVFDVFFGGGMGAGARRRGRRTRRQRGHDLLMAVDLGFEEAVFGVSKELSVETLLVCERCAGMGAESGTAASPCARCGGSGQIQEMGRSIFGTVVTAHPCSTCEGTGEVIASPCPECRGAGRRPGVRSVPLDVPAGVEDGMELRVTGAGEDGRAGGDAGDLTISLRVRPHPIFERRGRDLVCSLSVHMTEAALGTDVAIETLDGTETVRVDPGTGSGTVVRVKGKGVPHLGRRGRGDLLVTVLVETPKPRSKEERQLLERLAEVRGERTADGDGAPRLRSLFGR